MRIEEWLVVVREVAGAIALIGLKRVVELSLSERCSGHGDTLG